MCYEHLHRCNSCNCEYPCDIPNRLCPTINFDPDANLCSKCRKQLEEELNRLDEQELKERIRGKY